ncbi:uncharacterized protein EKO05_0003823 [Ascochyta rabiei]|uniref:Uncharacterized protein n=1 Tax=Didymella rabiei TaxID=5454 RepID=A0A163BZG7_DIDRA|nr:uncharacterized protein EKO05_0003823 [Ascochyta rabiei]KZM22109.1 hypothetical protein ST47_g6738 [Ascochyta rabiei]UPX13307.1 hypothetical protein EKO05_0003823 [Ascochyta rabiei]
MRFLRSFITNLGKRRFAQVHYVRVEYSRYPAKDLLEKENAEDNMSQSLNVFKKPLALHSTQPLTGFTRSGYCEVPKSDHGNHSIAGIVTNEFLDYSAAQGNNLRDIGLTDGCRWCLCVSRWREAFENRTGDADKKVPKVVLNATNQSALKEVDMEMLKKFAVDKEEK